jgi:hypothetical protein
MREITLPEGHSPYILYRATKATRRQPTPPQQRILDQMRQGVWFESEIGKDRTESCHALVAAGWCVMARIAKKGNDGNLVEKTFEDLLLDAVMGRKKEQPFEMYRIAKDRE